MIRSISFAQKMSHKTCDIMAMDYYSRFTAGSFIIGEVIGEVIGK